MTTPADQGLAAAALAEQVRQRMEATQLAEAAARAAEAARIAQQQQNR